MIKTYRCKGILTVLHIIITLTYIFTTTLLLRQIILVAAVLDVVSVVGVMLLAYFCEEKSYLIKKYFGGWIFFLPLCAIARIYGFSFIESQSIVLCLTGCVAGIVVILGYRINFFDNLIAGVLAFMILFLGWTGIVFDMNMAFDSHKVYETKETVIEKYQSDSGRMPELMPFLFLTVNLEAYGEIDITVSKKAYEKYERKDSVSVFLCEGAFHMKYAYIDEIPAAPIYRSLDYDD